jgi:hypothetical protein
VVRVVPLWEFASFIRQVLTEVSGVRISLPQHDSGCDSGSRSMTVVGQKSKAGVRYAKFGCTTYYSRGASVCPNNMTISEKKATAALLAALEDMFGDKEVIDQFVGTFKRRLKELASLRRGELDLRDVEEQIKEAEMRVGNVAGALAKIGFSEALMKQLAEEEGRLAALRTHRARRLGAPSAAPDPEKIERYLADLFRLLKTDVRRGRELLAQHLAPITMTPEGEGPSRHYMLAGAFNLSKCLQPANDDGSQLSQSSGGEI